MAAIPRQFTLLGASSAGGIITGLNGQTITGNSSGAWAIAANGTNQNITLAPSGTGVVSVLGDGSNPAIVRLSSAGGSFQSFNDTNATSGSRVYDMGSDAGAFYLSRRLNDGATAINAYNLMVINDRVLVGTNVDSGALLQVGTNTTTSAGGMVFGTDTFLYRSASNNMATTAIRLQLGGVSSSFAALSSAGGTYIDVILADNSAAAYLTALAFTARGAPTSFGAGTVGYGGTTASTVGAAGGASALPATPSGYINVNVAGTAMKVPYYAT